MIVAELILHGLMAVALLGAISHQLVSLLSQRSARTDSFVGRYAGVLPERFVGAIILLYISVLLLGGILLYPAYRVDVRIPFEELGLAWAVGLFELKEHLAAIGLGCLPLYARIWRSPLAETHLRDRRFITAFLFALIWFDFIIGHILNNIRGLG